MVFADLHVHTDCSDGQMRLREVPGAARRAGVRVVAITDHDRIHPDLPAPVVAFDGDGPTPVADPLPRDDSVVVIRGIELRVEAGDQRVDVLGYGLERTSAAEALVERIQTDREERGRRIIENVEDRLGIDLGLEPRRGIGRPHVARAVDEHPGTDMDYEAAFEELIGDDGPCFVARDVPSFATGRRILGDACGVVGLAHPLRYPDPAGALELAPDLDAVELPYPYGRAVDTAPVEDAVEAHGLLVTGGSDAHDDVLGVAGLDRETYEAIATALR
jgi:predicted metal-dependent phosphoesterase TrpH